MIKYRYVLHNKTKCPFCGAISYLGIGWDGVSCRHLGVGWNGVGCKHLTERADIEFKRNGVVKSGRRFKFALKEERGVR